MGLTPRDKLGASKIGYGRDRAAANTGKKGGQSLRASLGLKVMCKAQEDTAVKQHCNALLQEKCNFCSLTRTAIQ